LDKKKLDGDGSAGKIGLVVKVQPCQDYVRIYELNAV
jgi:hypothetical protein